MTTKTATASVLRTSTTFPEVDKLEEEILKSTAARWVEFARKTGQTVQFISDPGVGKTSFIRDYCANHLGLNVLSLHLPTLDLDRLSVALPSKSEGNETVLDTAVMTPLLEADVVLLDESRRAKESVRNSIMEMVQNKTIGGIPLKEGVTFILANNWSKESGVMTGGRDLAQESRFKTIELKAKDLPWQVALGATFADVDMSELFRLYTSMESRYPGSSKYVSPRTLEHIVWNILNDLPGEYGLPMLAGPREWIMSEKKGQEPENVTDEIMQSFCHALGKPFHKSSPKYAREALRKVIDQGKSIILQGAPGIGKTEYVKQVTREAGIPTLYWSMQNVNPDEHCVPFPTKDGRLELMLSKSVKPLDGEPYVFIEDEIWRAKPAVQNMLLEINQGSTLGGQPIPVHGVVAMTNPRIINGQRQSVNKPDRAMADRFFVSVDLTEADIPANEYLLNKYGADIAGPFLEWHKEDIDDLGRTYVNKRVLEGMMKIYEHFQDPNELVHGLPYINDEHVAVPLHDLKKRLNNNTPARLSYVLEHKDELQERMAKKSPDGGAEDQEAHVLVYTAITNAERSQLEEPAAFDALADLIGEMDRAHKTAIIRGDKEKLEIYGKLIREATRKQKQAATK